MPYPRKEYNQMIVLVDLLANKSHNKTGAVKLNVSMICLLRT
ncbi:hypothetical protein [Nitrosopumilus sp.]|nr:hypothetical protein [Nitrosopumilus sp.]